MYFDEPPKHPPVGRGTAVHGAVLALVLLLGTGCSRVPKPMPPAVPAASATAASPAASGAAGGGPAAPPAAPTAPGARAPAPGRTATHWDGYRVQAAERIVALNPSATYTGPVPEPLLAIPVLEIELNRDGSVRHIAVLRQPGQAADTVQLAMAAVRRAAPFAPVSHLPRPWKFTETFLFDGQRRFKPRSLDG